MALDVLVYYTDELDTLYDGDATTRINHMFAVTNQIFADSGVYASFSPVKLVKISYSGVLQSPALSELASGGGPFVGVDTLRYEQGADLVTLIHQSLPNDSSCGIANLNDPRNFSRGWGTYSVNAANCPDYVMAHEFGHNLGTLPTLRHWLRWLMPPQARVTVITMFT